MLLAVLGSLLCAVAALAVYVRVTCGHCRCSPSLEGKTAVVTGANTGIGRETARRLAELGARVILACRDPNKAEDAREDIVATSGNPHVFCEQLDLSSLLSVREFANRILQSESRLHILVNNAGLAGSSKITADGLELTMQVNHFGHFLLTVLLLDLLKRSAPSRIVVVTSLLHKRAHLDLHDLGCKAGKTSYMELYSRSKLCNVLMANELARRLQGTGVSVNSVHPGAVWTDVWRRYPPWQKRVLRTLALLFFKSSEQGAQTSIHLAVSSSLDGVSGQYFVDCKVAKPAPAALDEELASKVWNASMELVKLQDHQPRDTE